MSEQNVVGVARHGSTWQARSGMACLGPSGHGTAVGAWLGLAGPGSLGVARPGQSGSNMAVPGLAGAA